VRRRYNRQPVVGQLVPSMPNSYTERTSRPIYALLYLLGFLVFYEIGIFFIQPEALTQSLIQPEGQVVAFYWVRMVLQWLGFSTRMTWIAAPLMVIVILLALQVTSKSSWRVKWGDFVLMTGECILLSVPLIVLSLLLNRAVSEPNAAAPAAAAVGGNSLLMDIVTGIGAGIYEELVFRLVLICLLMLLFQDVFGLKKTTAVFWSVVISAVAFSIHHHIFYANGQLYRGDTFTIGKFMFRALAGVYFAVLYAVRGFGVTAGTHAFYNILAALLRMMVFTVRFH
jgi:hypothetical protein